MESLAMTCEVMSTGLVAEPPWIVAASVRPEIAPISTRTRRATNGDGCRSVRMLPFFVTVCCSVMSGWAVLVDRNIQGGGVLARRHGHSIGRDRGERSADATARGHHNEF